MQVGVKWGRGTSMENKMDLLKEYIERIKIYMVHM